MLDLRPRGRGFEPCGCHCVVSLSKNINHSLVLVQPRKTCPFITGRLLMGHKRIKQNKTKMQIITLQMSQHVIFWYLLHTQTAKAQKSLHILIGAITFYTRYGSTGTSPVFTVCHKVISLSISVYYQRWHIIRLDWPLCMEVDDGLDQKIKTSSRTV